MTRHSLVWLFMTVVALAASAQEIDTPEPVVQIDAPKCLPNLGHAPIIVRLDSDDSVSGVRIYFRRLNPLGSFYYLELYRVGAAIYSTVFPAPADRAQPELDDDWWSGIMSRDWLEGRGRSWLEGWLQDQTQEAAEYFVAVYDVYGERIVQTEALLLQVRKPGECPIRLSPKEQEWTEKIAIGETIEAQVGLPPFHWTCNGVVERISIDGRTRPDRTCMTGASNG